MNCFLPSWTMPNFLSWWLPPPGCVPNRPFLCSSCRHSGLWTTNQQMTIAPCITICLFSAVPAQSPVPGTGTLSSRGWSFFVWSHLDILEHVWQRNTYKAISDQLSDMGETSLGLLASSHCSYNTTVDWSVNVLIFCRRCLYYLAPSL